MGTENLDRAVSGSAGRVEAEKMGGELVRAEALEFGQGREPREGPSPEPASSSPRWAASPRPRHSPRGTPGSPMEIPTEPCCPRPDCSDLGLVSREMGPGWEDFCSPGRPLGSWAWVNVCISQVQNPPPCDWAPENVQNSSGAPHPKSEMLGRWGVRANRVRGSVGLLCTLG